MRPGYAGIDLAIAKRKRLPVALCTWRGHRLVPEDLRALPYEPPRGQGNVAVLDDAVPREFAEATARYLTDICRHLDIRLERIGIDAPSGPRADGVPRRAAELALDAARISCFTTPSVRDFRTIRRNVRRHLAQGGAENRLPHANQLWMIAGFQLFERLSDLAPCIEVFPQATARVLGARETHKFKQGGVSVQLSEAARHTGWPGGASTDTRFEDIAFGPAHDRLDAYLSAWVAALPPEDRIAFGDPPDDVIWAPRLPRGEASAPPQ